MIDLDGWLNALLRALDLVYGHPWVAPFIILPAMMLWAFGLRVRAERKTRPYITALKVREAALLKVLGSDNDPDVERRAFSDGFDDVIGIMTKGEEQVPSLVQAWREFRESIIDGGESGRVIQNTSRPSTFFFKAAPKQNGLVFASNIFVAAGLILTFLGLIVALNKAAHGMAGGDASAAQKALIGLLTVAAAKFFTSVAGLLASVLLRFTEHKLTKEVTARTEHLCDLLERGLLYVPPQKLAVMQLEVLREQSAELRTFNTDLALQIGERVGAQFAQAIAPMASSLSSLNENMLGVTQGIGAGAQKAIEEVSGQQLRGLSETLETLSAKLDGIGAAVAGSGAEAERQIRAAAEQFSAAATTMETTFQTLADRVDTLGAEMARQGEEAGRGHAEALGRAMSSFDAAHARNADMMTGAVEALHSASQTASRRMQEDLTAALSQGVQESQASFRTAAQEAQEAFGRVLETSGEGMRSASAGLSKAVSDAAGQVERAGLAFERSATATGNASSALESVADQSRLAASALGDASRGFASAAAPVAQAASAVGEAAGRMAQSAETSRAANSEALEKLGSLTTGIGRTQEAAETAWRDYRARFEGVDRSLEASVVKLTQTLGDSMDGFRRFGQEVDLQMAGAVTKLSAGLDAIQDYAETLDSYVETVRTGAMEPAE